MAPLSEPITLAWYSEDSVSTAYPDSASETWELAVSVSSTEPLSKTGVAKTARALTMSTAEPLSESAAAKTARALLVSVPDPLSESDAAKTARALTASLALPESENDADHIDPNVVAIGVLDIGDIPRGIFIFFGY